MQETLLRKHREKKTQTVPPEHYSQYEKVECVWNEFQAGKQFCCL